MIEDFVAVNVEDFSEQMRGGSLVGNFAGNREDRIHIDRHGQLLAFAVVDDATGRINGDGALLLARRLLHVFAVLEDLELDEAEANHGCPEKKQSPENVEPLLRVLGCCFFRQLQLRIETLQTQQAAQFLAA